MDLKAHLAELAEKLRSGCGPCIAYDEMVQWPKGRLEELVKIRVLTKGMNAKRIHCNDCQQEDAGCSGIEPIIEKLPSGETAACFLCLKGGGLKRVAIERLQIYEVVPERLEALGYLKEEAVRTAEAAQSRKRMRATKAEIENRNRIIAMAAAEIKLNNGRLATVDEVMDKTKLDRQQIYDSAAYKEGKIAKASAKATKDLAGSSVQSSEFYAGNSEEHGRQKRRSQSEQAELDALIEEQKEDDDSNFVMG